MSYRCVNAYNLRHMNVWFYSSVFPPVKWRLIIKFALLISKGDWLEVSRRNVWYCIINNKALYKRYSWFKIETFALRSCIQQGSMNIIPEVFIMGAFASPSLQVWTLTEHSSLTVVSWRAFKVVMNWASRWPVSEQRECLQTEGSRPGLCLSQWQWEWWWQQMQQWAGIAWQVPNGQILGKPESRETDLVRGWGPCVKALLLGTEQKCQGLGSHTKVWMEASLYCLASVPSLGSVVVTGSHIVHSKDVPLGPVPKDTAPWAADTRLEDIWVTTDLELPVFKGRFSISASGLGSIWPKVQDLDFTWAGSPGSLWRWRMGFSDVWARSVA